MSERSANRNQNRSREQWGARRGRRHPDLERLERDSFILLQHVYTVTGADPAVAVNRSRVGQELGFAEEESSRLIHYLNWVGYMKQSAAGPHLSIARDGVEYLEREAGRRHSVRAPADQPLPIRVFLG